ncbi:MAG: twin-arginine translocase TatA/TatE family subunit [Campylobacterota bacterium]|nr:twin-arginine translocase TatA/TatE family subunit [Campylobacterota bacterium]
MGMPGTTELVIILAVVLLLFGGKKIPELAKGLGTGIKNFKKSVKDDDAEVAQTDAPTKVEGSTENESVEAPKDTEKQA